MLFSSLTFLFLFLPILLALYYVSNDKYRNIILLIASLIFYAWGEPKYIILMLISILINYIIALLIERFDEKIILKKTLLIISLILNISFLFFFKYIDFAITNFNHLFGTNIKLLSLALPIGISFYTFQILSYVVDVYKNNVKVQKNIIMLGAYITLFPQLIAGPIVRYSTIESELKSRTVSFERIILGIKRFIIGLGKKIIIANNMALIADTIFNSGTVTEYSWITILVALFAYTFQIYFDFSGYSDMAIGLGKMFGFDFLENFNYPYIACSITDFWRRWHMSLSSWFRDYVYIPLGGNRCSKIRWLFNMLIVWLFTGLWHGASWNFCLWGLYYFFILVFEKMFIQKILKSLPKLIRWLYTFVLINIGWLLFRIENINILIDVFHNLVCLKKGNLINDIASNYYLLNNMPYFLIAILFSVPTIPFVASKIKNESIKIFIENLFLIIIFCLCIVYLISNSYNPFIYFRF